MIQVSEPLNGYFRFAFVRNPDRDECVTAFAPPLQANGLVLVRASDPDSLDPTRIIVLVTFVRIRTEANVSGMSVD